MDPALFIPIFGILVVLIPVAGLTLGLTLRLAVKPLVETLAKALRESRDTPGSDQVTAQLLRMQEDLETLTLEVRELRSSHDFDQRLLAARGGNAPVGD
jgi:hypothetical protein